MTTLSGSAFQSPAAVSTGKVRMPMVASLTDSTTISLTAAEPVIRLVLTAGGEKLNEDELRISSRNENRRKISTNAKH